MDPDSFEKHVRILKELKAIRADLAEIYSRLEKQEIAVLRLLKFLERK